MTSLDRIIQHTLVTLPKSHAEQKVLLGSVLDVITHKHPARKGVLGMLNALQSYDRAQALLPLTSGATANIKPKHDGHHDGNGDAQ